MKQSVMAKASRSPRASEIYKNLADAYSERAMKAMERMMHPASEVEDDAHCLIADRRQKGQEKPSI